MRDSCPEGSCPGVNYSGENVRESKVKGAIALCGILYKGIFREVIIQRGNYSGVIAWGEKPKR